MRFAALAALLLALACGDASGPTPPPPPPGPAPAPVPLTAPIEGAPGVTVHYGAYFDHGTTVPRDYTCGIKAYAGHRGVDILLRNFTVQDSGVGVIAAAPGTVLLTADGAFDRSTVNGSGGFGNHVIVDHADFTRTIYAHLRRGSIFVQPGAPVAGTRLGLVGSSGNSNWPHLHFEVQQGTAVDPFLGTCGHLGRSLWASQLPYQDAFKVVDAGTTNLPSVSFAMLLERPATVDTFLTTDPSLLYWLSLANINATATEFRLLDPDSAVAAQLASGPRSTFSATFGTWRVPIAGVLTKLGRYTFEFRHQPVGSVQPVVAHTASFVLVAGPIALRERAAPGLANGVAAFMGEGRDGPP